MATVDMKEFYARLSSSDCTDEVRAIVSHLRGAVAKCGSVEWRAHATKSGWGIRAKRGRRAVCYLDPKPSETKPGYVAVKISGAQDHELKHSGTVYPRKGARSWVHVHDLRAAALLMPLISRAYEEAGR